MIRLAQQRPDATGKKRLVFTHPDDMSLVIKVLRPEYCGGARAGESRRASMVRRYYFSTMLLRELREQVQLRFTGDEYPRFLHPVLGFVDTDLGPGLVSRAARTAAGVLAPTLMTLIRTGSVTEQMRADFERFRAAVVASGVVIGDLQPGNIVYAHDETQGSYFALVDGLGDKTFVPLLRMSKFLNRRAKTRKLARMARSMESESLPAQSRPAPRWYRLPALTRP